MQKCFSHFQLKYLNDPPTNSHHQGRRAKIIWGVLLSLHNQKTKVHKDLSLFLPSLFCQKSHPIFDLIFVEITNILLHTNTNNLT